MLGRRLGVWEVGDVRQLEAAVEIVVAMVAEPDREAELVELVRLHDHRPLLLGGAARVALLVVERRAVEAIGPDRHADLAEQQVGARERRQAEEPEQTVAQPAAVRKGVQGSLRRQA